MAFKDEIVGRLVMPWVLGVVALGIVGGSTGPVERSQTAQRDGGSLGTQEWFRLRTVPLPQVGCSDDAFVRLHLLHSGDDQRPVLLAVPYSYTSAWSKTLYLDWGFGWWRGPLTDPLQGASGFVSTAFGDFDGNGVEDILEFGEVAMEGYQGDTAPFFLMRYQEEMGGESFTPVCLPSDTEPRSIVVAGDFNDDGRVDYAVLEESRRLTPYWNLGDMHFRKGTPADLPWSAWGLAYGKIRAGDDSAILVSRRERPEVHRVVADHGGLVLADAQAAFALAEVVRLAATDVVGRLTKAQGLPGTPRPPIYEPLASLREHMMETAGLEVEAELNRMDGPYYVLRGDFNGDGADDFAFGWGKDDVGSLLEIVATTVGGLERRLVRFPDDVVYWDAVAGDIDSDGDCDVVAASYSVGDQASRIAVLECLARGS